MCGWQSLVEAVDHVEDDGEELVQQSVDVERNVGAGLLGDLFAPGLEVGVCPETRETAPIESRQTTNAGCCGTAGSSEFHPIASEPGTSFSLHNSQSQNKSNKGRNKPAKNPKAGNRQFRVLVSV